MYVATEKCVTVAVEKQPCYSEYSPGETDTGNTISIGPPLQNDAPCMEDRVVTGVEIFSTLHSEERVASLMTLTSEPRGRKHSGCERFSPG